MKRLIHFILCTCMLCGACNTEEEHVPPSRFDESLLSGKWILTEARGIGNFTSVGDAGNLSGSFLFIGSESDATLKFPTGVLAGGAFRDGAVTGTMTYDPGDLGFREDTLAWDGMLPNGAWTLKGEYLYFSDRIYGDFDGFIDELTEEKFVLTGRRSNIVVIGHSVSKGTNEATLDGVYTFTFTR